MIKDLKKYQIKLTPFQATKNWELDNVYNCGVLLLEQTGSDGSDISLALEFYDYGDGSGYPTTGSDCDVALEQQDSDKIYYREGQNIIGTFHTDKDPTNQDGTYKRSVYHQYKTSFYNHYRNPIEIWGIENIDFELSKTKRYLSDFIRIFDIPSMVYGDKIVPNTIFMIERTLDDNYTISDDGYGNLVAGTNLFSRKQEVGNFGNLFSDRVDSHCNDYFFPP
jgi:hypothetical protein